MTDVKRREFLAMLGSAGAAGAGWPRRHTPRRYRSRSLYLWAGKRVVAAKSSRPIE